MQSNRAPNPVVNFLDRLQVFFRRSEQPIIAGLVVASVIGIGVYYWSRSVSHAGIIDIDLAPERELIFLTDVNSAPWPELANLPGVGERLAKNIVEYRQKNGAFQSVDALVEVDGIGHNKLDKIKRFLHPVDSAPIAEQLSE